MQFDTRTPPTITPALKDAVQAYLLARAYTETIRPTVQTYQRATLAACKVRYDPKYADRIACDGEFITDPKWSWMGRDDEIANYWQSLHVAHLAHGFDVEPGYCPLLIAEHTEMQARWVICDEAEYISGLTRAQITINLDRFSHYVELIVGLVLTLCPDITTATVLADL